MAEHVIQLTDVGEGVAEAEVVEWHVKIGDFVQEDATLAAVMTDKATVEIPSPVAGEIIWLGAGIGDVVAVGSDLVRLKVRTGDDAAGTPPKRGMESHTTPAAALAEPPVQDPAGPVRMTPAPAVAAGSSRSLQANPSRPSVAGPPRPEGDKPIAAPSVRLRARNAGADLRQVHGTGPAGRITHDDLAGFLAPRPASANAGRLQPRTAVQDIKVVGLRRRIAEKMTIANARIPHITYIEEVDVTAVEALRGTLNKNRREGQARLTLLPFLMRAIVRAITEQPNLNALFDDDAGVVHQHAAVHIGIATQTSTGLLVPVVRHAEALDLWGSAAEVHRLAEAARNATATRNDLTGSTITITSLGAMGGVATTPIINHPEVAIVGVNKMMTRPVWDGSAFVPRLMINLSSSFDHRVVDGLDAATFVQRIKTLLETPALIFLEEC
jgi:2-oxoisovalerate dehydrogenase E2 component (dihydrolipoyl transacylase)